MLLFSEIANLAEVFSNDTMNISALNAKIFDKSNVDEVIIHDEVEGETQGRFEVAKITTLACKRSLCTKEKEPWNCTDGKIPF